MYSNNDYRNYLSHHGILGMHWGIRRYQPYGEGGYNPKKRRSVKETIKDFQTKRKAKETDRYRTKYGLTEKQADTLYYDRKKGRYSKKIANKIAKAYKKSYGNLTVAKSRVAGEEFAKRMLFIIGVNVLLSSPTARRTVARGAASAIKSMAKLGKNVNSAANSAKNMYWHFNPRNAPKQDIVDAVWREVGPASKHLPAVIR